jgi:hypothetical protein
MYEFVLYIIFNIIFKNFMLNNFSLLIPNINEILGVIFFFLLLFSFNLSGFFISKTKNFPLNMTIGWSIFVLLFHIFTIIFNAKISLFFYFYIFLTIIMFNFAYFKNKKKNNYHIKLDYLYFLFPLFIILISTKSFGWDTFAFYLPRLEFLLNHNTLPIDIFRSNYTFTNGILYHFINFLFNKNIENIPAIFDFILLCLSSLIFIKVLTFNKINIEKIIPVVFLFTFFNPLIMNVYSYSAYEDFQVSFLILIIVFFLYTKKFSINNFKINDCIALGLLFSLLSINKITGIVHCASIGLIIFLINFKFYNLNILNLKKLLIILIIGLLQISIWTYHLNVNEIFVATDFAGFREEIFNNILNGYLNQFVQKKFLIASIFLIPIITIIFYLRKNIVTETNKKLFLVVSGINIFWNLFLLVWFVYMQTFINAYEFHDFFRYISQLSLIFSLTILIVFSIIFKEFVQIFNKKKYGIILGILFICLTFINFDKIRRDLSPSMVALNETINTIQLNKDLPVKVLHYNSGYLKEILRYKIKNIKFINDEKSYPEYIKIEFLKNKFNITIKRITSKLIEDIEITNFLDIKLI